MSTVLVLPATISGMLMVRGNDLVKMRVVYRFWLHVTGLIALEVVYRSLVAHVAAPWMQQPGPAPSARRVLASAITHDVIHITVSPLPHLCHCQLIIRLNRKLLHYFSYYLKLIVVDNNTLIKDDKVVNVNNRIEIARNVFVTIPMATDNVED